VLIRIDFLLVGFTQQLVEVGRVSKLAGLGGIAAPGCTRGTRRKMVVLRHAGHAQEDGGVEDV
jgi:hypothetical protein